jgi:hypothetical protein
MLKFQTLLILYIYNKFEFLRISLRIKYIGKIFCLIIMKEKRKLKYENFSK